MGILFGAKNDTDQFLWDLVCRKLKNQTRRPINPGDYMPAMSKVARATVLTAKDRVRFAIGQTHAVQPKMSQPCVWMSETPGDYAHITKWFDSNLGKNSPKTMLQQSKESAFGYDGKPHAAQYLTANGYRAARIEIVDLWREDVRDISDADADAEGFSSRVGFWVCWLNCYKQLKDAAALNGPYNEGIFPDRSSFGREYLKFCNPAFFQAWVLSFKLVEA